MADIKNGNVTEKKRMTLEEVATELGINVKTLNAQTQSADDMRILEAALEGHEQLYARLEDMISKNDRKRGISRNDIHKLALLGQMDKEMLIYICQEIGNSPNPKQVINSIFDKKNVKVTIEIPSYVNEFYKAEAERNGLSRNAFLSQMLITLFDMGNGNVTDEQENGDQD